MDYDMETEIELYFHQLFSTDFKRDFNIKVLLNEELSFQEKFVSRYMSKITKILHPHFVTYTVENSRISDLNITVETSEFKTYEDMCEFIDENLKDKQMLVYLYFPTKGLHRLRYKFIDKNIKLYLSI